MSSLRQVPAAERVTRGHVLRTFAAGLAGAGMAGIAACGARGSSDGGGEASPRLGPSGFTFKQPVALTYWKSLEGPRHEAQVKLTDDFNATRTDVKVTLEHVGVYAQAAEKFTAALAADTPPDVMLLTVDTYLPGFARRGALQPLDEFARADKSARFDTYVPGFIKNGTINGKLYQIPLARSTPLLYFNKDYFRAAGLAETCARLQDLMHEMAAFAVLPAAGREGTAAAVPAAHGDPGGPFGHRAAD